MPVDPELYFELSVPELREVTRFALAPVEDALALCTAPADPRVTAALAAARAFADGGPRSKRQRVTASEAHRAAKEAADAVAGHVAAAAADAAASAFLHPFAKADQVGHILRSTAHAACAAAEAAGDPRASERVIRAAVQRATPTLLDVLRRYPPCPRGRTRLAQVMGDLDRALREA